MKKYELQLDSPHKMYDDVSSKYEYDNLSLNLGTVGTESSGHALSQDLNGGHSSVTLLVDHKRMALLGHESHIRNLQKVAAAYGILKKGNLRNLQKPWQKHGVFAVYGC